MLQVFVDDSKTGNEVLVLAGYIGHWKRWEQFSIEWQKLLDEHPRWDEFKMRRAIRFPDRAQRFYHVVKEHVAAYVTCAVEIGALRQLCQELGLPRFCRNPYNWALKALPGATYMQLGEVGASYPLDFIFDQRGEEKSVRAGWPFFILSLPPHARRLVSNQPQFGNSQDILPLQAAEIIAWHTREHWLKKKNFDGGIELSWPNPDPMKGLATCWGYKELKPNMESFRDLLIQAGAMTDPDL